MPPTARISPTFFVSGGVGGVCFGAVRSERVETSVSLLLLLVLLLLLLRGSRRLISIREKREREPWIKGGRREREGGGDL